MHTACKRTSRPQVDFLFDAYEAIMGDEPLSFLELGAGPAQHSLEMAESKLDVFCVERCAQMVEYSRELAAADDLAVTYLQEDMRDFAMPVRRLLMWPPVCVSGCVCDADALLVAAAATVRMLAATASRIRPHGSAHQSHSCDAATVAQLSHRHALHELLHSAERPAARCDANGAACRTVSRWTSPRASWARSSTCTRSTTACERCSARTRRSSPAASSLWSSSTLRTSLTARCSARARRGTCSSTAAGCGRRCER